MTEPLQTQKKTRTGMRPWLKAVMFVSLALNLAVAGAVIGALLKYGPRDGHHPPRLDAMMGPYTQALSHKDRRAIGEQMRHEYRSARPSREQLRAQFASVLEALRAQPFDPARVADLLAQQRDIGLKRQDLGQRLLLQRLETMSDAERSAFADRLEEGLRHRTFRKPD